jgi:MFS family permease
MDTIKVSTSSPIMYIYFSYALEIFSTRLIFVSLPILIIMAGKNDILGTFYSSLSYLGPVCFGYIAGSIVDKSNKRMVGYIASLSISIVTIIYCLADLFNSKVGTMLYLSYLSICSYFIGNMRVSIIPSIVKKDALVNANSIMSLIDNLSFFIVPAITSMILVFNNIRVVFYILAICFFLSSIIYLFSLNNFKENNNKRSNLNFTGSIKLLIGYKNFMSLVYIQMSSNAFIGIYTIYILVNAYASKTIDLMYVPYIITIMAIGAIIASASVKKINVILKEESNTVIFSVVIMMILSLIPFWIPNTITYLSTSFLIGFFNALLIINIGTARQKIIPAAVLGKVTGITSTLYKLSMICTIPLAGLIATYTGSKGALILSTILGTIGCIPYLKNMLTINKNTEPKK